MQYSMCWGFAWRPNSHKCKDEVKCEPEVVLKVLGGGPTLQEQLRWDGWSPYKYTRLECVCTWNTRVTRPWTQLKASSSVSSISTFVSFFSLEKERTFLILSCFYKDAIYCVSYCEEDSRGRRSDRLWDLFQVFFPERFRTPSSWSIICSSRVWSSALSGATEMSLTARNSPQLFRCSFSRRKKFHTKRLQEGHGQCEESHQHHLGARWSVKGRVQLKLTAKNYQIQHESREGIINGCSFVGELSH